MAAPKTSDTQPPEKNTPRALLTFLDPDDVPFIKLSTPKMTTQLDTTLLAPETLTLAAGFLQRAAENSRGKIDNWSALKSSEERQRQLIDRMVYAIQRQPDGSMPAALHRAVNDMFDTFRGQVSAKALSARPGSLRDWAPYVAIAALGGVAAYSSGPYGPNLSASSRAIAWGGGVMGAGAAGAFIFVPGTSRLYAPLRAMLRRMNDGFYRLNTQAIQQGFRDLVTNVVKAAPDLCRTDSAFDQSLSRQIIGQDDVEMAMVAAIHDRLKSEKPAPKGGVFAQALADTVKNSPQRRRHRVWKAGNPLSLVR
jgi:hypothetical protein